ncbi:MAG: VCBS repeat-containing protein [Xanthomonadales bacterium]|nr:VCBS repeat-containing protein [Xanthomonadales bacterium]
MRNRQEGATRRSGAIGMTGSGRIRDRARVGFATMLLTVLVGLGHPGAFPSSYAQAAPIPFDLVGDQTPVSLLGQLPAHDPTVGRLAGSASVSGGAASYEIPIAVPPGRRGMQPGLSLNYSSRAGNGIAGMGWSLSGLSSLHRCPQTLEQDGQIRAVQLDASDRLCLDGQRLILTGGTYGAVNATYGTELESFARVTQLGGDLTSATSYYKVERKSGEIAYYGNTGTAASAARVVPGGVSVPLTWMIARVEDRVGNAMHYNYTGYGDGETLVASIQYTSFGATLGDRMVAFSYEDRPSGAGSNDRSSSYLAGGLTRQTKRLTSVVTFVGSAPVRSYVLSYGLSTTTSRSLLQSVTDCAHDATNWICKPPTTFAWQQGAVTHSMKMPSLSLGAGADVTALRPVGDMDGDGATEVVTTSKSGSTLTNHLVSLTPERTVRWSMAIPSQYALYDLRGGSADFNQDGRVDFVGRDSTTGTLVVRTWSGSPTDTDFATAFGSIIDTGIAVPGVGASAYGVKHVGDMDGDGRADIVLLDAGITETGSCARKVRVYRNTPNGSAAPTFPEVASHCMEVTGSLFILGSYVDELVDSVRDFDGDGLADILIQSGNDYWNDQVSVEKGRKLDRILFGQKQGSTYSLTVKPFSTVFQTTYPRNTHEAKFGLFTLWTDVNGDGLDDWLYVGSDVKWKLRYNRGGVLGQAYNLDTSVGLAGCGDGTSTGNTHCGEVWQPWQAAHLAPGDHDGDGRSELLFPTAFAANICTYKYIDSGTCPGGDGTGFACQERWVCPEDPVTGQQIPGGAGTGVTVDFDGNGTPETEINQLAVGTHLKGFIDFSSYKMSALRITESASGVPAISAVPTGIVSGAVNLPSEDLYGDGHADGLLMSSPEFGLRDSFGILTSRGGATVSEAVSPRTIGGLPILTGNVLINENLGPGALKNPDGITPQTQDMLQMVTDGFGQQVLWNYSPLAGKAGRTAGMTPLYTVPTVASQRYIDERHIYFTSSMQVVSEMVQSDGIGGFRTWRYGYSEAMYNNQGRGFQGFRTLIEEDVLSGLRTTTTFHQKFPLTSQPERVVVNPISRSGEDGPISKQTYAWRCDRTSRANAAACVPTLGVPTKYFPFLDTKESWTYDATTAASGGTPATLGHTQEIAADDGNCAGTLSNGSGYDAWGNLVQRTVYSRDAGTGTGSASGTGNRLDRQCVSEVNSYTVDTANWWLDKLTGKLVTTKTTWDAAQHALPAGTSNPANTVSSSYVWNTNRTLSTETVQAGVANQQRVTAYTYHPTNDYGLPTGVAVSADGDANGTRSTGTTYTADGYFPLAVVNALGHSATTAVRPRDGQPSSVTDANGLRTLIDYDAFGLAVKKRFRGATDAVMVAPDQHTAVTRCVTGGACWRPVEQYQITTVQDGSPSRIERLDALGRASLSAEMQQDWVWTQSVSEYNAKGQLVWRTEPLRSGEQNWVWTSYLYDDILGRMTKKIVPKQGEDARGDMVTTYSYVGRTTNIQVQGSNDAPGVPGLSLSRTTDSLGRYVETRDALNGRTRFWYEANGNVAAIEDANGVVTKASYNAIGQRMSVNDPNQGSWGFAYNALGEVLAQSDARGIVTQISYDKLGRPQWRTATVDATGDNVADSVVDHWNYDPANAKGAPLDDARTINGVLERWTMRTYDSLARPIQSDVTQALASGTQSYRTRTKYDSYHGRPLGQEYPNGEAVQVLYSVYGHAVAEKDPGTGIEYRRTNSINARGQATQETFGNGVILTPTYQLQTGQLTGLTYSGASGNLRTLGYGYDVFGNVKRQSLNGGASREDYSYDQLHRMVQSIRSGAASGTVNYGYDAVGNIAKKSDFSSNTANAYTYTGGSCGGGANAVKSVQLAAGGTRTYCYDANGNLTGDNAGLSLKYDHQNLPVVAQRGALRDDFRYGTDGQRTRSWGSDGNRVYLPGYEHRTDTGETKVYIGDYAVISTTGATRKVEYLLKDRLGSVDAVANASGSVIETRGYDAFGKPRNGTWNDLNPAKIASTAVTPKGFTQHEHLNQLELIHMNGRAYDYNLGRFTGVDPFIQFPLNSQSLNPYSYILNNPLSGTDPTGYTTCDANGNAADCANAAGPGGEAKVYQQNAGSHIKTTVGSVKNNGDGSATFTNNAGQSKTFGGGNGSPSGQGTTGTSSRQNQTASASEKNTATNASASNAQGGNGSNPAEGSSVFLKQQKNDSDKEDVVASGFPEHIQNLFNDKKTRKEGLLELSKWLGTLVPNEDIEYVDVSYFPPDQDGNLGAAKTNAETLRMSFSNAAFHSNPWIVTSAFMHEYGHWLDFRFKIFEDFDPHERHMKTVEFQMNDHFFKKTSKWYQGEVKKLRNYYYDKWQCKEKALC